MIEVFFKLIRSGLYGTKLTAVDIPIDIDWKQVIKIAHSQTMEGLLADAVMRLSSEVQVPMKVKAQLMETALKIAKSHALLDNQLAEVVSFFRNEGISTLLLKGQGIARCYRNYTLRQCGDIDLYIGKENYDKACRLAHEKLEKGENTPYETQKHYHFYIGEVAIDMHHMAATPTIIHSKSFLKWVLSELAKESEYRHIDINGVQICLPPVSFDIFFIFYHAWRHLTFEGVGMRQLSDWAMVLNKYYDQVDLASLEQVLRRYRLMIPWQLFGNIVVEQLGLPKEKMPFYNPKLANKSNEILEIILEGGNFGFYSKRYIKDLKQKPFIQRNWLKLCKYAKRYMLLAPIIPLDTTFSIVSHVYNFSISRLRKMVKHKN